MTDGSTPNYSLRLVVVAVGCVVGLLQAVKGLGALYVSRGTLADWVMITCVFFSTLPGALIGLAAPRHAGLLLAAAAIGSLTALSIESGEISPRLLLLYTGPTLLVAMGLLGAYTAELRRLRTSAHSTSGG